MKEVKGINTFNKCIISINNDFIVNLLFTKLFGYIKTW